MMTRIKLCGLSRLCDVDAVNDLRPEYAGFVFWEKSRRYVAPELAASLRKNLAAGIQAVGVFVDECPERIAALTGLGVIDVVQLHGSEDNAYISRLRTLTGVQSLFTAGLGRSPRKHSRFRDAGLRQGHRDYLRLVDSSRFRASVLPRWRLDTRKRCSSYPRD